MNFSFKKLNQSMWKSHKDTKDLVTMAELRTHSNAGVATAEMPGKKQTAAVGKEQSDRKKSYSTTQMIGLFLGPVLFLLVLFALPLPGLSDPGRAVLAITAWMSVWWLSEAIPLGITSLMPLILLPLMGAVDGNTAASSYGDSLIFLFIGGFALALALERWNLHERIAITVLSAVGASTSGLVLGFMIATGFISMWVSNMATVMLMIPIGLAIIAKVVTLMKEDDVYTVEEEQKFTKSIVFAIGFGGTIGGSATLIGTPTNLVLAGLAKELFGFEISFAHFFLFAFPLTVLLMIFSIFYITKIAYPMKVKKIANGRQFVLDRKQELGKLGYEEKVVLAIFLLTGFFWMTRTFLWSDLIPGLSDTMIAMVAAVLLHAIPASGNTGERLLGADSLKNMPWGVLLLVGGGLALASGFNGTDLASWIGSQLMLLDGAPYLLVLLITTLLGIGMTQMTPNTATVTILVPIAAALALAIDVHPLPLMTAVAMGAGFAFMLPIGTPSNAIIFATGKITMIDMLRKGTGLTVLALLLIVVFVYFVLPVIFGINQFEYPASLK
ncbi:SLC13/DASS family transporter [Planococcus glaciei]|uniref:Sodium-dependent dicarboxylate transporter SdcS n=1 Tax=Planococcus glaciei TaxID=459472 RepID=A0A7H8Q873_9BACL|nr:DASS family sodium-coupled anion symporter [Planococcus glaciei]QKX50168.1 SLC13/DASS family transporter [Planococcus glaciei]